MSATSLLFRTLTKLDTITLDATISEAHEGEVDVTEHPVEQGADVTDHARPKPDNYMLTGLISDTPLSPGQARRAGVAEGTVKEIPGRSQLVYEQLRTLKDTGKLITVVTGLRTYENMLVTKLSAPRDNKTGDALMFTMGLRQIRIVQNKTTQVVVAIEPKAKKKAKLGKQTAKTAAAPTVKKSILETQAEAGNLGDYLQTIAKSD